MLRHLCYSTGVNNHSDFLENIVIAPSLHQPGGESLGGWAHLTAPNTFPSHSEHKPRYDEILPTWFPHTLDFPLNSAAVNSESTPPRPHTNLLPESSAAT